MQKKIPINVPVFIQDFKNEAVEEGNGKFTKARLKIFYEGETVDHRLFTKEFSDRILQTLPYTPVVGYYSVQKGDFLGHNAIQYVYGLVPENPNLTEEYDETTGHTYKVADVILYTEREDNIGDVAQKIVGKQQSLEMDRNSVRYKVNRNFDGSFRNLEFLDGKFVGLSVLGDCENPAFEGSAFFAAQDILSTVAEKFTQNLDSFIQFLNNHDGGSIEIMENNTYFSTLSEFLKRTMQEVQEKLQAAFNRMGNYGVLVQNTEDEAVFLVWGDECGEFAYHRYTYGFAGESNDIVLSNPTVVYPRYLSEDEINPAPQPMFEAEPEDEEEKPVEEEPIEEEKEDEEAFAATEDEEPKEGEEKEEEESTPTECADQSDEDEQKEEQVQEQTEEEEKEEEAFAAEETEEKEDPEKEEPETEEEPKDDEDEEAAPTFSSTTVISQGEDNNAQQKTEGAHEESENKVGEVATSFSSTTLTSEERAELEHYRRREKLNLINEYSNDLAPETIEVFTATVDNYSYATLEAELAIAFRKAAKTAPRTTSFTGTSTMPYSFMTCGEVKPYDENDPVQVINKFK